jgi:hypothetical protein
MKTLFTLSSVLLVAVLAAGCLHHTFTVGSGAPDGRQVYKVWHHHWLFGIIRPKHQKNVEVAEFCPSGNATIYEKTSFLNGLVDVLVGIIYSPTTVTILCDDGTRAAVELSEEEVAEVVHDPLFLEVVAELVPERMAEVQAAYRTQADVMALGP